MEDLKKVQKELKDSINYLRNQRPEAIDIRLITKLVNAKKLVKDLRLHDVKKPFYGENINDLDENITCSNQKPSESTTEPIYSFVAQFKISETNMVFLVRATSFKEAAAIVMENFKGKEINKISITKELIKI